MGRLTGYPVDLHMHSCYSDGLHTPSELVNMAQKLCLTTIALCDHDTVSGLEVMMDAISESEKETGRRVEFIPAVELSCGEDSKTHLLGYGADCRNPALMQELSAAMNRRKNRMERMIQNLSEIGVVFSGDALQRLRKPGTGRANLARELIRLGVVNTMQQAFDRYLSPGRPGFAAIKRLGAAEGIRLLSDAGAVPVLAHPMRLPLNGEARIALMEELVKAGLGGIEAWHPSADGKQAMQLESWARRKGLLVTGGSDFHGDPNTSVAMGHMPSGWKSWQEDVLALKNACAANRRRS